ncbi:MAG: hypothetical protein NWF01_09470 [Candidatus Bathyarchaeota archaeon]|nr:hypothetical protein [Candidatus Bathyarchaeota archaeon]
MTGGIKDLKIKDLLLGIAAPIIVCLIIIWFPLNERTLASLGFGGALQGILVFGVQEVIMIVAVPMLLGLLWNKWAGGASGFLLGSIYALWYGLYGSMQMGWINNLSLLGYILSAMLIGYMSGALSQKSQKLSRLLFSGFIAALSGGLFLFLTAQLSRFNFLAGYYGFFVTMTPRLIFGILIPVIAWYVLKHIEKQKTQQNPT